MSSVEPLLTEWKGKVFAFVLTVVPLMIAALIGWGAESTKVDAANNRLDVYGKNAHAMDDRLRVVEADDAMSKAYLADIRDSLREINIKLDHELADKPKY